MANIGPDTPWADAQQPRLNPHGVIAFARDQYGKQYAENTRETIRRQAIHQFIQGGVLARNPDDPSLPTNSPRTHYALTDEALGVVRAFGTDAFEQKARDFLMAVGGGLAARYAEPRAQASITVQLPGQEITLSPGSHNELQRLIIERFLPAFAPKAQVLYLGDTDHKTLLLDTEGLAALGISMTRHDKLPDVVAYDRDRHWLLLIEAVTSHGPVSPKRRLELQEALKGASPGLVYVSAFLDFQEFKRHADQIAWETEVWISDVPTHLLHFNGDRFLGPR